MVLPSLASLCHTVMEKLTRDNFLVWKAQLLPHIRAAGMTGYLDGSVKEPAKVLSTEKDVAGKKVIEEVNNYARSYPLPSFHDNATCIGSTDDWIALRQDDHADGCSYLLYNPFSNGSILLALDGIIDKATTVFAVFSIAWLLFAGPIFNDYSSVGYSFLLKKEKAVIVQPDRVTVGNGPAFGCIMMKDFLTELGKRLKKNTTAYENYKRIWVPEGQPPESEPGEPLRVNVLFKHIQKMLTGDSAVIAETGDSWFNCQKLKLPDGCGYEFQMQYGSIGWSVGALLGYAQGATDKRVIACIGDGSFQVTAQDVSTMLRCGQNSIIFLINNGGYTIEVEIHDGPYNVIKNWNYTGLVDAIHNGEGNCWTTKVTCEEELTAAIETATGDKKDCLCFIEVVAHKDDTSKELLEWGSRVSAANSRPPNPQ
uniref:pyruvate decarboxylase n=1 Tax=Aegilops tauschii TaxID=37682 RepID=M8B9R4_AEGTA